MRILAIQEKIKLDGTDSKGYAVYPLGGFPCLYCSHLISEKNRHCRAFPQGIPLEIWNGANDHSTLFPGDKGLIFKD